MRASSSILLLIALLFLCLLPRPRAATAQQEVDTPTPTITPLPTATATPPAHPQLTAPLAGEALLGQVPITGMSGLPNFYEAELFFAYTGDPTGTWFLLDENFNPVQDGLLATWDTFAISDGTYDLRLRITLQDGRTEETVVRGVRVRNYSSIETSTATPTPTPTVSPTVDLTQAFTPSATPTETAPPGATPLPPTLTPLPRNPAEITSQQIGDTLLRGAAGTLAAFLLLGIYLSLRRRR